MTITVTCPCGVDLTVENAELPDAMKLIRRFNADHPCDPKRAEDRMAYFNRAATRRDEP